MSIKWPKNCNPMAHLPKPNERLTLKNETRTSGEMLKAAGLTIEDVCIALGLPVPAPQEQESPEPQQEAVRPPKT